MAEKKNIPEIRFKRFSEEWEEKELKNCYCSVIPSETY